MKYLLLFIIISVFTLSIYAQSTPSADAVLKEACQKATKENKKVMVIFHASWCVWCHKMDSSLNDRSVKDVFDKNYVITHLVVSESDNKKHLENPGAEELFKKWSNGLDGIPFWVIMDKDGQIIADSKDKENNVGCPATIEEVAYFINVLKKTSSINDEQIAAVEKRFRRNE
jgi:thioredoxin-related protein